MDRAGFDTFCGNLGGTAHVEQWGGASVWKLGGKIFAICSKWGAGTHTKISFKTSDLSYAILIEQPGIIIGKLTKTKRKELGMTIPLN